MTADMRWNFSQDRDTPSRMELDPQLISGTSFMFWYVSMAVCESWMESTLCEFRIKLDVEQPMSLWRTKHKSRDKLGSH